jgi:titin
LTYTDENLEPGKAYYYILRAVNSMGKGDWTPFQIAVATMGVPDAPMLMAEAVSRMAIELTWDMPDAKGATIVGYQIQRRSATVTTWADIADRNGSNTVTVTEQTDTGLMAATMYYYRIRALTAAGTGGPWSAPDDSTSGAATATTHGDTPAAPADGSFTVTAERDDDAGTVTIVWVAPTGADIGGSPITNYSVQRYNSATGMWDVIGTPTAVTYSDRGRTRGMTYYYRVAAVNAQGTGPYTAYKMAEIPEGTPDAPVLTAAPTGPRTIQLSWNIPADNGEAITGFLVQKWGDSDANTDGVQWGWVTLDVNPADGESSGTPTQTFFVDEDVMPNTRYDYQISTETGNGDSDFAQAFATTHVGAPGRPMMVMATGESQTSIKLTWTAPSNNGSPIDRYEIWMWDTTTRSWGWNGVAGNVHTVRHPVATYTHTGLTEGTQNIYRVRAVNGATTDNGGVGMWSTIVSGRTKAAE